MGVKTIAKGLCSVSLLLQQTLLVHSKRITTQYLMQTKPKL